MPFTRPITEEEYQGIKGKIRAEAHKKFPGDKQRQERYVYGSKIIRKLRGQA